MVSRSQDVSTDSKQILHDTVNRREPLELSGRRETPHLALTLSGRLMGDLRAVVRVLIGAVRHRRHHRATGSRVAAQLVGDQASRHLPLVFQQLAKEAHRGVPIPSRLHEDVEDVTVLIHSAPQVLLATLDRDEQLVEMPEVAEPATSAPQSARILRSEPPTPLPDGLMGDFDTPAGQQVLHVSEAEREAMIEPHRVADDFRGKPVSAAAGHAVTLPAGGQVDNAGDSPSAGTTGAVRGDELPAELRRRADRLAAIEAARERLEAAQRRADDERGRQPEQDRPAKGGRPYQREYGEPEPKAQSNFTDPQSRIMKTSTEGFQQSYNAQTAVDDAHQVVVGASVGAKANDVEQLLPMLDAVEETLGKKPQEVLADAGYCSEANLRELEKRDIDGYVALGREGKKQAAVDPATRPATGRMKKRLETEAGRARYARRKWLSEAPNGWIKEVLGFRRFRFRGLAKVQAEWNLVCLAVNIKRIGALTTA